MLLRNRGEHITSIVWGIDMKYMENGLKANKESNYVDVQWKQIMNAREANQCAQTTKKYEYLYTNKKHQLLT